MSSTVWAAVIIIFLALILVLVLDNTDLSMESGDRLMFGAIGVAGFVMAILTDIKDEPFIIG